MHTHTLTYKHTYKHTLAHTCTHTHTLTRTRTHTHAHIFRLINTHKHSYTQDGTLVVTKSGAEFPLGANDWQFYNSEVPKKLKQYADEGYRIALFT